MSGDADLVQAARQARLRAHAPYSRFLVGAALAGLDTQGQPAVFTGCNIENASYGLTLCAERVAIFKALSEGGSGFSRLVVVADSSVPTPPCGACRQIIWEFCGDIPVLLAHPEHAQVTRVQSLELLPRPFGFKPRV